VLWKGSVDPEVCWSTCVSGGDWCTFIDRHGQIRKSREQSSRLGSWQWCCSFVGLV